MPVGTMAVSFAANSWVFQSRLNPIGTSASFMRSRVALSIDFSRERTYSRSSSVASSDEGAATGARAGGSFRSN